MNDGLDQLAQCCDEFGLVQFRSLRSDVGQAPDVGEIPLNRCRVHGDDLGSGSDLCELGLDAPPFGCELTPIAGPAKPPSLAGSKTRGDYPAIAAISLREILSPSFA